jgi:hypothetical protein
MNMLYIAPRQEEATEWYQPPKNAGYNEDSGKTNHQRADNLEMNRTLSRNKRLRKTSTSVSIAIQALGFCALGLLSLINRHQPCGADRLSLEMAFSVIGSTASILLGGIFLVAGSLYWNR